MIPFQTYKQLFIICIMTMCCSFLSNAQNSNDIDGSKVVVWSKVENGYQVQMIREGSHDYILKTPLELVEAKHTDVVLSKPETVLAQGLFVIDPNQENYIIPEVQNPDLVSSRIYYMNTGMPLTYNQQVQTEVERLVQHRISLETAIGRSKFFLPQIDSVLYSSYIHLPKALKYLPLVESGFKPYSHSRAGAKGIWQFMPGTAKLYGLKVNRTKDQRLHPKKSTEAALTYLNDLHALFNDWELALASYNCGPGRVQRAIKVSGLEQPSFWEIQHLLPKETRRYVPKFIAAVYVMEHASQMGLLANIEGYKEVEEEIASLQKSNFATDSYIPSSFIPQNSTILYYTVKSGDNLGFIAEWYDVKATQLRRWNQLSGNLIKAGQTLSVYVPKQQAHIYKNINKLSFAQKQGGGKNNSNLSAQSNTLAVNNNNRNYVIYKIQSGDTLWDISRKNGISIDEIKQLNNISNTRNLKPGMVIKIREKS